MQGILDFFVWRDVARTAFDRCGEMSQGWHSIDEVSQNMFKFVYRFECFEGSKRGRRMGRTKVIKAKRRSEASMNNSRTAKGFSRGER